MGPAFDPEASETDRKEAIDRFLSIPKGSKELDPGLGRRLREKVDSAADLMEPDLYVFLQCMFQRVVVTSTYVERVFKDLSHWSRVNPQSVSTIAAKHVNHVYNRFATNWRKTAGHAMVNEGRKRPAWVRTRSSECAGMHSTSLHEFCKGKRNQFCFADLTAAWKNASEEEKQQFRSRAATRRKVAAAQDPLLVAASSLEEADPPEGPLQISCRKGPFPVHRDVIAKAYAGKQLAMFSSEWDALFEPTVKDNESFPDHIPSDGPRQTVVPDELQKTVTEMLKIIRLSLRFLDSNEDVGLLFEFDDGNDSIYALIGHSMHLNQEEFEAEVFIMVPCGSNEVGDEGCLPTLTYTRVKGTNQKACLQIQTEKDFVTDLAQMTNAVWEMHHLRNEVLSLGKRKVTARTKISKANLEELDVERLKQVAAMKAFRLSAGLRRPEQRRGTSGRGRGRGKSARSGRRATGHTQGGAASSHVEDGVTSGHAGASSHVKDGGAKPKTAKPHTPKVMSESTDSNSGSSESSETACSGDAADEGKLVELWLRRKVVRDLQGRHFTERGSSNIGGARRSLLSHGSSRVGRWLDMAWCVDAIGMRTATRPILHARRH